MKIYVIVWNISGQVYVEGAYAKRSMAEDHIARMRKDMRQGYYVIREVKVVENEFNN